MVLKCFSFFYILSKYSKRSVNKANNKDSHLGKWHFVCSLESIESNTDSSQSHKKPQHNPEEWVCLDHGPTKLEDGGWLRVCCPNIRLIFRYTRHFLQILKDLDGFDRGKKIRMRCIVSFNHWA